MRSYWRLNGGLGSNMQVFQLLANSRAWQSAWDVSQVVVKKGERSRSANSRADSADRRAGWDVTTVANEKGAMSKRASAASMVNAEPLEM